MKAMGFQRKIKIRIFDPYFTLKQSGNGLGLATVHSIITRHGGLISCKSEIDKGTVFTIHLPAEKEIKKLPEIRIEKKSKNREKNQRKYY